MSERRCPVCEKCQVERELKGVWGTKDYDYFLYQCPNCHDVLIVEDSITSE